MNAKKPTDRAIRFAVSIIAIVVALEIGSRFMPIWAAVAVAAVTSLVLQEIAVLVLAEVKGRKSKAGA